MVHRRYLGCTCRYVSPVDGTSVRSVKYVWRYFVLSNIDVFASSPPPFSDCRPISILGPIFPAALSKSKIPCIRRCRWFMFAARTKTDNELERVIVAWTLSVARESLPFYFQILAIGFDRDSISFSPSILFRFEKFCVCSSIYLMFTNDVKIAITRQNYSRAYMVV